MAFCMEATHFSTQR